MAMVRYPWGGICLVCWCYQLTCLVRAIVVVFGVSGVLSSKARKVNFVRVFGLDASCEKKFGVENGVILPNKSRWCSEKKIGWGLSSVKALVGLLP